MQFLAILRRLTESFSSAEFDATLEDEAEAVRTLYAEGIVRNAWSREDVLGGCLLIEANSLDEANGALRRLPLVAKRMAELRIIPLKSYRGFGPRG